MSDRIRAGDVGVWDGSLYNYAVLVFISVSDDQMIVHSYDEEFAPQVQILSRGAEGRAWADKDQWEGSGWRFL